METAFLLGVIDIVAVEDSDDLVVIGNGKGRIEKGNAVCLANVGVDDSPVNIAVVKEVNYSKDKEWVVADEAQNCIMGLRIEHGLKLNLRRGTVVHTREADEKSVQDTYVATIGDGYVIKDKLDIRDEILERMSITDLTEVWRLNGWYYTNVAKDVSEEERKTNVERLNKVCAMLSRKLIVADSLYCVYSKATGEPYLFSRTAKKEQGFMCTPPNIRVIPKAYFSTYVNSYPSDKFELKLIENDEKKTAIYNFFGDAFFLNGAEGVEVITDNTAIGAPILVKKPDYSNLPAEKVPVMNPGVERWMLMLGQLGTPETDDEKLIQRLYFGFLSQEMIKAKFIVPMKTDAENTEGGKLTLTKDNSMKIVTQKGRGERPAVRMFTDWKRLRAQHDGEWGGLLQTVEGMIGTFDVTLNTSPYIRSGCYITPELYKDMKETVESIDEMRKSVENK